MVMRAYMSSRQRAHRVTSRFVVVLILLSLTMAFIAISPKADRGSDTGVIKQGENAPAVPTAPAPTVGAPSKRWGAQLAGDPAEGYTLLFGGSSGHIIQNGVNYGDTWEYRSGIWTDISPSECSNVSCPTSRSNFAMSYYDHSDQQYVVLFGGQYGGLGHAFLGDTWLFNGSWHNITPNPLVPYRNSPPSLNDASMAWDPVDGYSVLFGGCSLPGCSTSSPTPSAISCQTWGFEGISLQGQARWVNLTSGFHPPHLYGEGLAFDSFDKYLVLFGGGSPGVAQPIYQNQTWTYTAKTGWLNRTVAAPEASNTPPSRALIGGQLVYDPSLKSVVLFGGQHDWASPTSGDKSANATLNDTWTFQAGSWSNITDELVDSPPARFGGAIAFDPSDHVVLLFGGLSGTMVHAPLLNDTWWMKGKPPAWTNHTAAYAVALTESGLVSGTNWSIGIADQPRSSDASSISFGLANGTHGYAVMASVYVAKSPPNSPLTVVGAAALVTGRLS